MQVTQAHSKESYKVFSTIQIKPQEGADSRQWCIMYRVGRQLNLNSIGLQNWWYTGQGRKWYSFRFYQEKNCNNNWDPIRGTNLCGTDFWNIKWDILYK